MIYIIVPIFNRIENLPSLFKQLDSQTYRDFKLVLVDHGSNRADRSTFPDYVVYLQGTEDQWWSGAVNIGLQYIFSVAQPSDYILLQNDDVDFGPELLEVLLQVSREHNAVVGAITLERGTRRVLDANNRLSFWRARHICPHKEKDLSKIEGSFLEADVLKGRGVLYPVPIAKKIGYTDERLHYRADPEWSYRAKKKNYKLGVTTKTQVETTLDTQEGNYEKSGIRKILYSLFSKRSTQNIPAAWRYFVHCFGIGAIYAIVVHTVRCILYYSTKELLGFFNYGKQPN